MDQLKGLSLQGIMKAIELKSLKISMDWIGIKIKWVKWTTYLMKVYLGKLCVSSNLIQCKSAIHVIYHIQKPARDHLLRLIVLLMSVSQLDENSRTSSVSTMSPDDEVYKRLC